MNYKNQLFLSIGIINIRLLILLTGLFFPSIVPGFPASYIFLLYALIDIFLVGYLYHFVKNIKQQPFSLWATLLFVVVIGYNWYATWFNVLDNATWNAMQRQLISLLAFISRVVLIIQLLRNNAEDDSKKYLAWIGWSYILSLLIIYSLPFVKVADNSFPLMIMYVMALSSIISLVAMLILYVNEWKRLSDVVPSIEDSTAESEE